MLQGILIIVVFLVIAALMMTKKIPTLLALPLMAVIICIIAGVPPWAPTPKAMPSAGCRRWWKTALSVWAAPSWPLFSAHGSAS